jgi:hypothetical protein
VKFVLFFGQSSEDVDKLIPKFQRWHEALKSNPEKHVKMIFPPHFLSMVNEKGDYKGISIFESDNEEKIIEYMMAYFPEMKMRIVPLLDAAKMIEGYLKTRK